jgi:hypothetical protein
MKLPVVFDKCVFINCPLDRDYEPILQAILFCLIYLGFTPRIATESNDSGENRLKKIQGLIENSKYSIHDLSRCISSKEGEYFRLNMPFELGIDYGCRQYYGKGREKKKFLILEERKYQSKQALSDLAGCDMQEHEGKYDIAIRKVRNWIVSEARIKAKGTGHIISAYTADFQEWHYEKMLAEGFSENDIKDYPTSELLEAMKEWIALGKPI